MLAEVINVRRGSNIGLFDRLCCTNLSEELQMQYRGMLFLPLKKPTYRIHNWSEYNSSLKQQGRLTI
jgi:hypothetical protein